MVSPIPTPTPASLGILFWKPGAAELPAASGLAPRFPSGHPPPPFHLHFSLSSFLSLFFPPILKSNALPLRPCSTSPGAQTYLAATFPGVFLATFIFLPSRIHLFPRCSQHLGLHPSAGKTRPGVPSPLPSEPGAEPPRVRTPRNPLRSPVLQANCKYGNIKSGVFFCPLGLGCKGREPPPRGAPLSFKPKKAESFYFKP